MLCTVHPSGDFILYNLSLISNKQIPTDVMVLHVTFSASFIIPFYIAERWTCLLGSGLTDLTIVFKNPHGHCAKSSYHSVNPHAHWENHENHYSMEWAGYMPFWPILLPIQKTFGSPYHALAQIPHLHLSRHNGPHLACSRIRFYLCPQIYLLR